MSSGFSSQKSNTKSLKDSEPPLFTIDLSRPPDERHTHICKVYETQLRALTPLYDDLLDSTSHPKLLRFAARHFLRSVHSPEESAEIEGIARATDIPRHLVVAFNTFLDLFAGCLSGGIMLGSSDMRIVHFRNLDWHMDVLRPLLIRVEYVRKGIVVARAVTYAGYVGVLTGVRQGLSLSMNYRGGYPSQSSTLANRWHFLLVLLGYRPSIPSALRQILLGFGPPPPLSHLASSLTKKRLSPSYLVFCSPTDVLLLEKDLGTAKAITSPSFLLVTNHDSDGVRPPSERELEIQKDSVQRKECVRRLRAGLNAPPTVDDVQRWLSTNPAANRFTHFSCVMDPTVEGGGILWSKMYESPVKASAH